MKKLKKFKILSLSLIFLLFINFSNVLNVYSKDNNKNSTNNSVNLVLDNKNYDVLPLKFRTTTDLQALDDSTLNLKGLKELNIAGSEQFSKMNLPLLIKAINTDLPIIDYDLRQESHGFINGLPVSFENEKNNANKGLNNKEALKKESSLLSSIVIGSKVCFYNDDKTCITVNNVSDEKKITKDNNINYKRIFATDEELPDASSIDDFVDSITKIDDDYFLYFHCKEGIGRTTTFMIFYDMIKNYKDVESTDIVNRQINLAPFDEDDIKLLTSEKRFDLYNSFYDYCKKNGEKFDVKYSDYISNNK